jgi:hypothetical protein
MNNISNGYIFDLDLDIPILKNKNHINDLEVSGLKIGHFKLSNEQISNEYLEWILNLNLVIDWAEIFYCAPGERIFIHSDDVFPEGCCKMNWVFGKENIPINWYKTNSVLEYRETTIGGYYYTCDEADMYFDFSAYINNPSIIRVDRLHGVENNTEHAWWCVAIVLKEINGITHRITWDQAPSIFKDYIR